MNSSNGKKGILNNTLYDIENTYSLDFETTGTGKGARIWSIGMTGGKDSSFNKEFFIADAIRYIDPIGSDSEGNAKPLSIAEQLLQAHKQTGASFFGEKQMQAGSFQPFEDALLAKKGTTVSQAIGSLNDKLKKDPGILLIQNANFENGRLLNATYRAGKDGTAVDKPIIEDLVQNVLGRDLEYLERGNVLNVSEENFLARKELNSVIEDFKLGKKGVTLDDIVESKNNLRSVIDNEISSKISKGYSVPVELMDLTKMLQIDMASKGLIGGNVVGYANGMEILAELLLSQKETHMALDDTHKQVDVYDVFKKTTQALERGETPDFLQPYIKAVNENEGNIHDIAFLKNLRSRVEEVHKKKDKLTEKQLDEMISNATDYYLHAPETNVDRHLVAAKIKDAFNEADEKVKATNVMQLIDDFQERIPKLNNGEALLPPVKPDITKAMSANTKIAIGAGIMGAIGLISTVSNKDEKSKNPSTYNELYSNVELGSAYADWKERNNAHKSIY